MTNVVGRGVLGIVSFEYEQVPGNDAYRLNPMPVPAVLVTLKGGAGGLIIDEDSGKEVFTACCAATLYAVYSQLFPGCQECLCVILIRVS